MSAEPAGMRIIKLRALLLATMLLAVMAWFGWHVGRQMSGAEVTARPALWRISAEGRQAYLFGTIHALPRDVSWLSPQVQRAVAGSDRLVLEVTGLDEERRSGATFQRLGRSPGLPPVASRLGRADATHFLAIQRRHASALKSLDGYESWAAALLLNAAASSDLGLSSGNAGEAVLAERFTAAHKPVSGLETIQGQLGLFDTLPEADQRMLLTQAVREADDARKLYADLLRAWARGDVDGLERRFLAPLASAPGLRHVLLDDRNRRWATKIDADLRRAPGTAFIAVGAGHLLGRDSLQARLAERGWRIERIQ